MPGRSRLRRPIRARLTAFVVAAALLVGMPGVAVAAQSWSISASVASVEVETPTDVTMTVKNTSTSDGGSNAIECIRVTIPSEFTVVGSPVVNSVSNGALWSVSSSPGSGTVIEARAGSDASKLRGEPDFDQLVMTVTVTGTVIGNYTWVADEYEKSDCTRRYDATELLPMAINDGVDDGPTAIDDSAGGVHDRDVVVDAPGVLDNDTDPENDALTASVVTGPANGTLSLAADGSYVYSPDPGFVGSDSFTYVASDGPQASAPATVTLTITNDAPVAADDAWPVEKNVALTVGAPGALANDTDGDGDGLTAAAISGPSNGTLSLAADGSFTYTPDAGFTGTDSFAYSASDGLAADQATVTLTVSNTAPAAIGDTYSAAKNVTKVVPAASGVLVNDTDTNGDPLTAVIVTGPSNGTVSLAGSGGFSYSPDAGFTGSDEFVYAASDGSLSTPATVSIAVANDAPDGQPDAATVVHDRSISVAAPGVLANDSDANGDALTAIVSSSPSNGTLALAANGGWTYTPAPSFVGDDTFEYVANDGSASSAPILVTITVTNVAPVATGETAATSRNAPISVAAPGLLANDVDADGDSLTASVASGPTNGSLSLAPNGAWTYTPDPGFVGADGFTYNVSDGAATATAGVFISVTNTPPTAADDTATVRHDRTLTVPAPGVLANDDDPDGDTLTALLTSPPADGAVVLAADGSYVYVPRPGFTGTDSFQYVANDGLASSPATVTITVKNTAPVAVADVATTEEGSVLIVGAPGVLGNDSDADGDAITATLQAGPANGTLILAANGSFIYTPDAGFSGTDTFTYAAGDGITSSVATVTITVEAAPLATPSPAPTATLAPTPTPKPTPTPTPTASAKTTPTPEPSLTPSPSPSPSAVASQAPSPSPTVPPPTEPPASPPPSADAFVIPGSAAGGAGTSEIDVRLASAGLGSLGVFMWLVPGMALSVPGLLVVLAIAAQAVGGLAWIPLVRMKVGAMGANNRRRSDPRRPRA